MIEFHCRILQDKIDQDVFVGSCIEHSYIICQGNSIENVKEKLKKALLFHIKSDNLSPSHRDLYIENKDEYVDWIIDHGIHELII